MPRMQNPKKQLQSSKDEYLRTEAVQFFEWCRFNLHHKMELLSQEDREQFEAGNTTESLLSAVEAIWLENLKTSLTWRDQFAAIRRALPAKSDYDKFMSSPYGRLEGLPRRILDAVAKEFSLKQNANHSRFLLSSGQNRLETYLRIWQSRSRAMRKLIRKAWGYEEKAGGGASLGGVEIDVERMMLSQAEATGSAIHVRGLLPFVRSLWEKEKTILVKTGNSELYPTAMDCGPGYERRVIPNPSMSEKRLNRFLIKLGRALAMTTKRRKLPDWTHMDQTIRFIVHAWCENITVDDEPWPMLCLLSTPALAKFLSLCKAPRWSQHQDARTLERRILRLGLLRITTGRINHVKRTAAGIDLS
jgi:hypothetical protein